MNDYQWLINRNAAEKRARQFKRGGERTRDVHFDEWSLVVCGVADPRSIERKARGKLFKEYQDDMIHMGFTEWDCAEYWELPSYYNLFGR